MCTTSAISGLNSVRKLADRSEALKVETKKEDKRKIATIAPSPFIDFKPISSDTNDAFHVVALISVSEKGEGFLHNIKYNNGIRKKPKLYKSLTTDAFGKMKSPPADIETAVSTSKAKKYQNQIEIEEIKDF